LNLGQKSLGFKRVYTKASVCLPAKGWWFTSTPPNIRLEQGEDKQTLLLNILKDNKQAAKNMKKSDWQPDCPKKPVWLFKSRRCAARSKNPTYKWLSLTKSRLGIRRTSAKVVSDESVCLYGKL